MPIWQGAGDGEKRWRLRFCISLPLLPLQSLPLSLLRGQTAKEFPHFPLSLRVSEKKKTKKNRTCKTSEAFTDRNISQKHFASTRTLRVIRTCSWPPRASLWPGSASPSWSPSERPWTPSCTCASIAPSLAPLWCCHASFRSPTWQILKKQKRYLKQMHYQKNTLS